MNEAKRIQAILAIEQAKDIHVGWVERITNDDSDDLEIGIAGDTEWHQYWIDEYENVLEVLRNDS